MADSAQVEILKQGRDIWNDWRNQHPDVLIDLRGADLDDAKLGADQRGTNRPATNLSGADLRGANLRFAQLIGPLYPLSDLADLNRRGHRGNEGGLTNANLEQANLWGAYLHSANLQGANLQGANLNHADLFGANFRDADLRGANLTGTHPYRGSFHGANLSGAFLGGVNLNATDLRHADLSASTLTGTSLVGTLITDAKIDHAELGNTVFGDLDLRTVTGLETCVHRGPSVLDHRTLMQSGQLPLVFLRGCGLPDRLIEYLPSLLETAVQFYSCFISYSTDDQVFADRLYSDLQNKGVRCWFAPQSAEGGKKLHEQIDEAIRVYDKLLLILSPASVRSEWVKTEIAKARHKEVQQDRRMLFPLTLVAYETLREWECFDADTGKDSAKEIREYFIPDFSQWKDHEAYTPAFERLLRDLVETH